VLGLGPVGDFACRIGAHKGYRVIGVDLVPERLARVRARGIEVLDLGEHGDDLGDVIRELTGGRGPDSVLDAVGMEAHGSPATTFVQKAAGLLPSAIAAPIQEKAGVDRLSALYSAIDMVRRGGTISLSGVYGGAADPIPMLTLFDKQIALHMGQCNVKRWIPDIMPLLTDGDPLGVDTFATHRLPLAEAPGAYRKFQEKSDGFVKVQLKPEALHAVP
jgi:threonine dehydrogenase-like Zn-dependent dehydrogenase